MFGYTYGKTSYMSSAGSIAKGLDHTPDIKYTSIFKHNYVNHADYTHETTAQIVGVQRAEDSYKQVTPSLP